MFGFQKYITMLHKLKWEFPEQDKTELEQLFYVKFKKDENYFVIEQVLYTYIDILIALENMNFEMKKNADEIIIKICN